MHYIPAVHDITHLVTFACVSFVVWKPSQNPWCSDAECTSFFFRHKLDHKTFLSGNLCMNLVCGVQAFWNDTEMFYVWKKFFAHVVLSGLSEVTSGFQKQFRTTAVSGLTEAQLYRGPSNWNLCEWHYDSAPDTVACSLANHATPSLMSFLCLVLGVRRLIIFSTTGLLQLLFSLWCPL